MPDPSKRARTTDLSIENRSYGLSSVSGQIVPNTLRPTLNLKHFGVIPYLLSKFVIQPRMTAGAPGSMLTCRQNQGLVGVLERPFLRSEHTDKKIPVRGKPHGDKGVDGLSF